MNASRIAMPLRRHHQDVVCNELLWASGQVKADPCLRVWLLYATISGRGRIQAGHSTDIVCRAGDVVLIQPGRSKRASATPGRSWRLFGCHFPGRAQWSPWLQWPALERGVMRLHLEDPRVRRGVHDCLRLAARALAEADALSVPLAANHLERALILCQRALPLSADRLTSDEIAAEAHCSPQHLRELFRRQTGKTPLQHQREQRMVRAMHLLRETSLPVGEIAGAVGYGDPFYFSNHFRHRTGLSPRAYRLSGQHGPAG